MNTQLLKEVRSHLGSEKFSLNNQIDLGTTFLYTPEGRYVHQYCGSVAGIVVVLSGWAPSKLGGDRIQRYLNDGEVESSTVVEQALVELGIKEFPKFPLRVLPSFDPKWDDPEFMVDIIHCSSTEEDVLWMLDKMIESC